MRSIHVATVAVVVAAVAWTAKAIAIGIAGGLELSSYESPLFLGGLVAFATAAVSLGVAVSAGRPAWRRALMGVLALVTGAAVTFLVDAVVGAIVTPGPDRHWAWSEVNLWFALAVAGGWLAVVRRRSAMSRPTVPTPVTAARTQTALPA